MEQVSSVKILGLDKKSLARARKLGAEEMARSPVALSYSAKSDTLNITMPSGTRVIIPRMWIWEIAHLPKSAMKKIYLDKFREMYMIDEYDVQISAMGLLRHAVMGEDPYARAGRATSPAKARAARRNGAKGGRPRKKASTHR